MPRRPSSNGNPRLDRRPDSSLWQIRFYCPARRKVVYQSTGCEAREAAEIALANFLRKRGDSGATDTATKKNRTAVKESRSIRRLLDDYIKEHAQHLPSANTSRINATHLKTFFGDDPIDTLTYKRQDEYAALREQSVKHSTINRELDVLRSALLHAEANGRIGKAPAIYALEAEEVRERWLTPDEFGRLLGGCQAQHIWLYMLLAVTTCARPSAILDLRWDRTDFQSDIIHLNPVGRAQTSKKRPTVKMPPALKQALLEARTQAFTDYVIEYGGYPLGSIKKAFKNAVKRAGFADDDKIVPYTLRHTGATWLAQAGVSLWSIADLLGHADLRMVIKHYAHHHPEYQDRTAAKLHEIVTSEAVAPHLRPRLHSSTPEHRAKRRANYLKNNGNAMVGAAGIEPATPTMST